MNLLFVFLGYILVTVYFTSTANGLQCLECQEMPHPEDCRVITTCSGSSKCYVEQVVSSGGLVLYSMGCTSESRCTSKRSFGQKRISKRQDTISSTDIVTCIQCCDGEFCNIEGCGQKASKQPQRPPLCFTCSNQINPNSCRDVTLCDQEHMCALQQTVSFSVEWKSECVPTLQCQTLAQLSLANNNGPCYTCCQEDFCNNICNQHASTTTTSLAPASATTHILSSVLTSTENPMVTPTKRSTDNAISTLSAVLTSSTSNTNTTGTSTTIPKSVPSSIVTSSVSVPDKMTKMSSTSRMDTTKPMTSTYKLNITTSYPHSTDSTNIWKTSTAKSDISSSHAVATSTDSLTSITFNNASATVLFYDQSTRQTSSLRTMTSSFEKSHGMTEATEITTSPVTSTVSVQTSGTLTNNVTPSSKTSLSYSSTPVQNTSASTRKPVTLPIGCNNRTLDICFVIDSSGSLGQNGFAIELQFVKEMVHTIASETTADAEFCVVTFSTKAHVYVKLQQFSTVDEILKAIEQIPFSNGETYIDLGLQKALHTFNRFGRHGAETEVILVTDGKSTDPVKTFHAARHLKSHGSDIYAVSVGAHTNNSELAHIVTDQSHLIEVQDIDHLHGTQTNILKNLCRSTHETPAPE
ncbi:uncharacterized protein LOC123556350 isoform X2 [Mercenaria mercenaria]|uniref:uncharacterized protein LOC123556350 isoform X2 n=1 Tax=Mercenaria mercenaria TaxID=6596 RepID=UPI00234F5A2D|nr:uncharacterized protein LOC123556350 isoform X2 [Mercenaria mercenaria]